MDAFEAHVPVQDLRESINIVDALEQRPHMVSNISGRARLTHCDLIRQALVIADREPIKISLDAPLLQYAMQILHIFLADRSSGAFDDAIDSAEVVPRLDNVIDSQALAANSRRLEDQTGLFLGQLRTLDVIRVVGHLHL